MIVSQKKKLINFENKIANLFNLAKIRAPVHLHSGNELSLIKIFKKIKKNDWIFCSWRSHYHCLLKGVPENTTHDSPQPFRLKPGSRTRPFATYTTRGLAFRACI